MPEEPTKRMETGLRHRARRVAGQISRQHRHLNPLFEALADAIEERARDRAEVALARFRDAINAHFSLEDEFFFPALHGLCPEHERELEGLSRDHERLQGELRRIGAHLEASEVDGAYEALNTFAAALSAHEGREEQLVRGITATRS